METEQINGYLEKISEMVITYAPKLIAAILILWIGLKVVNRISRLAMAGLERMGISDNLLPFMKSLVSVSLKVILLLVVASIAGFDLTSLVAVLAAAGFAVGLALQGSLSNFAAGILVLVFRPYKVGDWIGVEDNFWKVEEIQIFNTIIGTPGNKTLIIPNSQVVESVVTNFSAKGCVRLELNVTMPYEESYPKVQKVILDTLATTEGVLSDPAPEVGIESYDSHSIILAVRPFVDPEEYWDVTFRVHERIKAAFHDHSIKVAYSEGVEIGTIGG